MDITTTAILAAAGFAGGVWNAMASGATLFTFPILLAAGLPPVVANATSYLALLPSNAAAIPAYLKELRSVGSTIWPILVVANLGAILLVRSGDALFTNLVPMLILGASLLFAFGSKLHDFLIRQFGVNSDRSKSVLYALLFAFSIYGGYFGAGLGIILLAVMEVMGFQDFHVANSLKNLLATTLTICSIVIFGLNGVIDWTAARAMMAGSTVGGYLGGVYGRMVSQKLLRGILISFGFFLSTYYLAA